jgi:ankyrin repeat protein
LLQGSYGNTALHYACLLEKAKHAELLLEYGALPEARNEHGQRPLDLVPRDAVRSTKLHFKRIFDVSVPDPPLCGGFLF